MHISIVVPLYKCEPFVTELVNRLKQSLLQITNDYEIILVNDASPMNDWQLVKQATATDKNVKGINLSRNFGQHYAITAGLDYASGNWVVVMDGDLQDQPEDIAALYQYATNNKYDVVWGRRVVRKHKLAKRVSSWVFYKVFDYLSGYTTDPTVANFSVINRKVVNAYKQMREQNRAYPMFLQWAGFNHGFVNINHAERSAGESSYNFSRLCRLAFDATIAYSNKPLRIGLSLGIAISSISFIFALYYILKYFILGIAVPGFTSMIVSLWFIGGMIIAFLGLLGLYIGKIFDEGKKRPIYFVSDKLNFADRTLK